MSNHEQQITHFLHRMRDGDADAAGEMLPLLYDDLRGLAGHMLRSGRPGHTLQPTALVNEAYLRLGGAKGFNFANRAHFFGAAAEAMRRILVDSARRNRVNAAILLVLASPEFQVQK